MNTVRDSGQRALRLSKRGARRALLALEPRLRGRGLAVRAWRAWETAVAAVSRDEAAHADGGLPVPPVALRIRVIAVGDAAVFLDTGKAEASALATACVEHGLAIENARRLLDFGCGCGRVTRHWASVPTLEIHGTDHDADQIAWVRDGLPFVRAQTNELAPPLAYPDDHFDIACAVSVFTHMTDELAQAWMTELDRIIRPGGLALITALDERQAGRLRPHERSAFDRGESVVQFEDALGTNMCVSFHPAAYIEAISPGFELLSALRMGPQMLYVLRSTASIKKTSHPGARTG